MNRRGISLLILAVVMGATALLSLPARANITITPTIVVIDGRQRYTDINIINVTSQRQSYEIGWKFMKMEEGTGAYQSAEKSLTDFDLTQNIVFTPRRLTLEPKGVQKVRLALRLKGTPPPPGDYRGHIFLLNKAARPEADASEVAGQKEVEASISMNVGFTIPVVYRVGDENGGDATIGNVTTEINPKTNKIDAIIPINRTEGPYGTIGTITVNYGGKRVGQMRNANIFPEIKGRVFHVPLTIQTLSGGSLEIIYSDYDTDKKLVFDQKTVNIAR